MMGLKEAVELLKKNVEGAEPTAYWVRSDHYVFRLNDFTVGCNYYIVKGNEVIGTNPIISKLSFDDMRLFK